MMPSLRRYLPLCLSLAVLLSACGKGDAAKAGGPGGRSSGPVPVVVETVRAQEWTDALRALGTVHAREAVTVTAKVSETVQQVHFESGQQVARGAALVTLSGQQQQASLASAEAALKEAEQQYQRYAQLVSQQLVARSTLDAQRATRDAARAQVAQIRANLSDRVIRAPFAGVLGIRQVSPGALVTPGTAIATLDDVSRVFVDFPVPETELADVGAGQALVGHVATFGERSFDGTVSTVSARLGNETFVWRVKADGTVEKANVEVGGRVPGKVMLKAGVEAGQRIVTEGVGKLQAGAKVAEGGAATNPAPAAK